ncbi:MAG: DUF881 domain-containing protein [Clostridia bacterium]|nr:DUF881 domain-containing protein [Clostridia bacterium]
MHHKNKILPGLDKKLIFFLAFLLLGVLITMQSRSVLMMKKEKTTTAMRIDNYMLQLEKEKQKVEELKNQIAVNEKKKEKYLKEFSEDNKSNNYLNWLGTELERFKIVAGLTDVKGSGVIITLNDAPARDTTHPEYFIIHDSDVVGVCNELKKAGAQAISVSGERLIANSELVCAGPTIKINKNRYPVPFEIKAIGNPALLTEVLEKSRIVNELKNFEIKVEIAKSEEIIIEKYNYKIDDLLTGLEVVKK